MTVRIRKRTTARRNKKYSELLKRGDRFFSLTFVRVFKTKKNVKAECICDCGKSTNPVATELLNGKIKSCGCHRARATGERSRTHGLTTSSTYCRWANMKKRCLNKEDKAYHNYGGRGIEVCERWMKFENFLKDMGIAPSGMTLDRIENDGNYEPGNCRWASPFTQANNQRKSIRINAFGKKLSIKELCKETGFKYSTILRRFKIGWSHDAIVSKTPQPTK